MDQPKWMEAPFDGGHALAKFVARNGRWELTQVVIDAELIDSRVMARARVALSRATRIANSGALGTAAASSSPVPVQLYVWNPRTGAQVDTA
ncbi:MAG TPA: hypothetical protein VGX25_04765 [Actinophytocola sp.]|uniref:hypothetical protein n=1 Tax=Actinophytocola sp. TaxID=1872138 RepID=UPI002DDD30D1|nr:hypothetical protein [Actinophytocola sp.]HEV2778694.1 hypothetical protein [Actinophytocola sp.]